MMRGTLLKCCKKNKKINKGWWIRLKEKSLQNYDGAVFFPPVHHSEVPASAPGHVCVWVWNIVHRGCLELLASHSSVSLLEGSYSNSSDQVEVKKYVFCWRIFKSHADLVTSTRRPFGLLMRLCYPWSPRLFILASVLWHFYLMSHRMTLCGEKYQLEKSIKKNMIKCPYVSLLNHKIQVKTTGHISLLSSQTWIVIF